MISTFFGFLIACGVCFGTADPRVTWILMGLLVLPFAMVGGMFTFLYYRGVFSNPQPDEVLQEKVPPGG